jgi:hypothetical protein
MRRLCGIAVVALLCWCHSAVASLVVTDFKFFGVDLSPIGNPATVNVVVRLSYDLNQPDGDPLDTTQGAYSGTFALSSGIDSAGPAGASISVRDDATDVFLVSVNFGNPFPSISGTQFSVAELEVGSVTGSLFSSDALPPNAGFASAADAQLFFRLGDNDATNTLPFESFQIEAVPNPVPEPSAYVLLIAGFGGLLAAVRLRRR